MKGLNLRTSSAVAVAEESRGTFKDNSGEVVCVVCETPHTHLALCENCGRPVCAGRGGSLCRQRHWSVYHTDTLGRA